MSYARSLLLTEAGLNSPRGAASSQKTAPDFHGASGSDDDCAARLTQPASTMVRAPAAFAALINSHDTDSAL